jgi:hypothetical protein
MRPRVNLFAVVMALALSWSVGASAQRAELRPAVPFSLPFVVDSNTASFWLGGRYHLFSSAGSPILHEGTDASQISSAGYVELAAGLPEPVWVESVWMDDDGILFAWYHHEVLDVCPGTTLTVPKIGAAISRDGGRTMLDLGIVLESGDPPSCEAQNGYFAGGHGDFSVVFDRAQGYFYFLFSNYGGEAADQGIAVARMPFESRFNPAGTVWKYRNGEWNEPGLGGRVTPVFPAAAAWQREDTDALWGPSVHWNTHINQYVMLMNRACCWANWPQEGVYLSFNADLSRPEGWTPPQRILEGGDWYPHVLGTGPLETGSIAGETVRLFVGNYSEWELVFRLDEQGGSEPGEP